MTVPATDPTRIDASPTKAFFTAMLVRDIPLDRAIIDLVDNSVDGALRERPDHNWAAYVVEINFDRDHFLISDNCGGIPVSVARNYAFKFGRPTDQDCTTESIGRFGVGMKRALFKMGGAFVVRSTTRDSRF